MYINYIMPKESDINAESLKIKGITIDFSKDARHQQVLGYNAFTERWEPTYMPCLLDHFEDVDTDGLIKDDILVFNGITWVPHDHITDTSIHYPMSCIDHDQISNNGDYKHNEIDAHIRNQNIHFTVSSIDHTLLLKSGKYEHSKIDEHIENDTIHFTVSSIDHTKLINKGKYTHQYIDAHIDGDGSDHSFIDQDVTTNATPRFKKVFLAYDPEDNSDATNKGYVDAICQGIMWKEHVQGYWNASETLPSEKEKGDRYICCANGNGWKQNYIYQWTGSRWKQIIPKLRYALWNQELDMLIIFNGEKWVKIGSTVDHKNLKNIGMISHADIDAHILNKHIHFTVASIDHTKLRNIGSYDHSDIDEHIEDKELHFTERSIDHDHIRNIGKYSHSELDKHIDDKNSNPHNVTLAQLSPTDTQGDLIVSSGQSEFIKMPIGKQGEVLMVNQYSPTLMSWEQLPQEKGNRLFMIKLAGPLPCSVAMTTIAGHFTIYATMHMRLKLDSVFPKLGDKILITDHSELAGVYIVEKIGSSKESFVLQRDRDFDAEVKHGDIVFVKEGAINTSQIFVVSIHDYQTTDNRHEHYYSFTAACGSTNYPYSMVKRLKPFSVNHTESVLLKFENKGRTMDCHDPEQLYAPQLGAFVIQVPGLYLASANLYIRSGIASGIHRLKLYYKRGRHSFEVTRAVIRNQNDVNLTFGARLLRLLPGDRIYCVYENRTGSFVVVGQAGLDFFNIVRLR